ncbi:hypothetical protein Plhal304r1_c060g0146651 [Plasmopara halstedii]
MEKGTAFVTKAAKRLSTVGVTSFLRYALGCVYPGDGKGFCRDLDRHWDFSHIKAPSHPYQN